MNPGGDYGKKELSPALSNRFTTIWVPSMTDTSELREILMSRLQRDTVALTPLIIKFWEFYKQEIAGLARQVLTVRDLLTWVDFINVAPTSPLLAYVHGAHIAFLDGIGLGVGLSETVGLPFLSRYISLFKLFLTHPSSAYRTGKCKSTREMLSIFRETAPN